MSTQVDSKSSKERVRDDDVFVLDDCDEDVPGDFFDDFLKEDFMAGLDIVDDDQWENGEFKKGGKVDLTGKNKETDGEIAKKSVEDRDSKYKRGRRDNRNKEINVDTFDIRRDPNKTKRDIERDKAKVVKDQEKKLITEKLKLVETGLVPPGMEMEVDLNEIEKDKGVVVEPDLKSASPTKRKESSLRTGSPRRRTSPRRRSPRHSSKYSPRRSPVRRRSRDRFAHERRAREFRERESFSHRRSRDRRSPRRSNERIHRNSRRSRSNSTYHDRRQRMSPNYLRRRRRRSREKSNDDKKSFLQEIVEKLRGTQPAIGHQFVPERQAGPPMQSIPPMQAMQAIPSQMESIHSQVQQHHLPGNPGAIQPVPAPTFPINQQPINQQIQLSSQSQYDPYDQSFFIGTPQSSFAYSQAQHLSPMQIQESQGHSATNQKADFPSLDVEKLFHGKKITLSEFLAMTAKSEGSPIQLKDKIKVLSRCHDAIKILESEEKKFQGRLQLRKSIKQPTSDNAYRSPLVKLAETKISFTELPSKEKHKSAFTTQLNNLLRDIGLLTDVVDLDDQSDCMLNSTVMRDTSPPPPPTISRQWSTKRFVDPPVRIHLEKYLSKMSQTEPDKCPECEKRRKVTVSTAECQTGELMTYSVSTQVTEEDLVCRIPKNQSLASLTPAQLLAQSSGGSTPSKRYLDSNDFDVYPPKAHFVRSGYDSTGARFVPNERDRFESSDSHYPGARGRGSSNNNYDTGPRYSYY